VHSWDNANSEYVLYMAVDSKGEEFNGNKVHSLTYSALYISTEEV